MPSIILVHKTLRLACPFSKHSFIRCAISTLLVFFLTATTRCAAFTLITFDVDGTLVKGSGQSADASAHSRAFAYACGKVLGNGKPTKPVAQVLPQQLYHGSTDGLILCRLAKAELGIEQVTESQLQAMMESMYDYIAGLHDDEIAKGIEPLPGVMDQLTALAALQKQQPNANLACGLVTGNVEGIARRKMKAVGILDTQALSPPSPEQQQLPTIKMPWPGAEEMGFLGGFGSDYCSRNIHDLTRNYLDRGEQIAIAARRCQSMLLSSSSDATTSTTTLSRIVHVGDAPSDVLAAKVFAEHVQLQLAAATKVDNNNNNNNNKNNLLCVGMVAVATGSYTAQQLQEVAGKPIPGVWEPVILEKGLADPNFLKACGL
jgi:phosphoglycolate phosphatase-like HAD superfamily hydrolase